MWIQLSPCLHMFTTSSWWAIAIMIIYFAASSFICFSFYLSHDFLFVFLVQNTSQSQHHSWGEMQSCWICLFILQICGKRQRLDALLFLLQKDAPKSGIIFVSEQVCTISFTSSSLYFEIRPSCSSIIACMYFE